MEQNLSAPTREEILASHERIKPYINKTPVIKSQTVDERCEASIFFKCENFQKVGAFKFRGACNAVLSLGAEDAGKGVATHSSGNHAQALALAGKIRNIRAHIVMPENSPRVKINAVKGYGAEITFCKPTLEAREQTLESVVAKTGATFIHPYNDYRIIAGQATSCLELIDEITDLDYIFVPVGGGGLLSGTLLAAEYFGPEIDVFAGEPQNADDAYRSIAAGHIIPVDTALTVADGLKTSLGDKTFPIIRDHVKEIITVSDNDIIAAMKFVWERMKILIEPSSAVPLAALINNKERFKCRRVGIILSGGNVDLDNLPW